LIEVLEKHNFIKTLEAIPHKQTTSCSLKYSHFIAEFSNSIKKHYIMIGQLLNCVPCEYLTLLSV